MRNIENMGKFNEKYDIRIAQYDEIEEIMEFIDEYWKKGHILATNREFFEYELVVEGQVNVVIAKDKKTKKICGLHGFRQASKNVEKLDTWGGIWKVIPGSMGLLGLEIIKRWETISRARTFLSIGANPDTAVPIYRSIKHYEDVEKMDHFYCLANREKYMVAQVKHYEPFVEKQENQVEVMLFNNMEELKQHYDISANIDALPYKDEWYVQHRFFDHPIYTYKVYGLVRNGKVQAIMVCREQECNETTVLRIVDYIGKAELFAGISCFLKKCLETYEYVDFYCHGFDVSYVEQAGMVRLEEHDTNIIPNYFSPYVAENVDIWVGAPKKGALFFKADGDQDRPS